MEPTLSTPLVMFPGQSSFRPDVVVRAVAAWPALHPVVAQAEETLGRSLRALSRRNRDVQVGVFVANHLHVLALEEAGVRARRSLGLSLGEYNHLVHVGAIDFLDCLRLVDARGALYDEGPPGCMAAIFPLALDELEPLLEGTSAAVANFNAPTQHVVAGSHDDVAEVCRRVEDTTFAQHRLIEAAIPMHHPLFAPVAERFAPVLAAAPWRTPAAEYVTNVTGDAVPEAGPAVIAALLARHVCEPVRWQQCVERVLEDVPGAVFVEAGPGRVLHDLGRRWTGRPHLHTEDGPALDACVEAFSGEMRRAC